MGASKKLGSPLLLNVLFWRTNRPVRKFT